MTSAKYPGWRTMTHAQRHNARQDRIFEEAMALRYGADWRARDAARDVERVGKLGHGADGPARDTFAQAERASAPGFDPTCVFCESGEEHEH